MSGRSSKRSRKSIGRKANKLKKFVDSFVFCITANQNSEETEDQASTIVEEIHKIDQTAANGTTEYKMFKYELKAMLKFDGEKYFPNVIGILPNPESAVCFSLVQDFIGDEKTKTSLSLADYLQGKGERLSHQQLISVTLDVAEALKTIHEKGWVHCDLKPDNVMLQETGQAFPINTTKYNPDGFWIHEVPNEAVCNDKIGVHAKMIDFGLAGPIGEAKMPITLSKSMKKAVYQLFPQIAPEVVKGLGKVPYSCESDIYSLGFLLKEVSSNGLKVLQKLSERCMAKIPGKRPSIFEVIDNLKNIQTSYENLATIS